VHLDEDIDYEEWDKQAWKSERIELDSIGIDIGSSTSHLIISSLVLRRRGREYYSGYTVVDRQILYKSPILLTPYINNNYTIDAGKLEEFISAAYAEAGLTPDAIDSGAVITTGEAARKDNAANIIDFFAEQAGKFVCATAGPTLEAVLAAHGSGAVQKSLAHHIDSDGNSRHPVILNVDIGGGTTKIALVHEGKVIETSVVDVGSRSVAWDESNILTRVEQSAHAVAADLGFTLLAGKEITTEQKERLARKLTQILFTLIRRESLCPIASKLMVTPPLSFGGPIDVVTYSGGVSEYIYGNEHGNYGDLGNLLGDYIRTANERAGFKVEEAQQGIRATVIGASQYTVQVSGNTIFISDSDALPIRNLPVISISATGKQLQESAISASISKELDLMGIERDTQPVAVSVRWDQEPRFDIIETFLKGLEAGLHISIENKLPIVTIFDKDVANLVGEELQRRLGGNNTIICVDSIDIKGLNFVDIGRPLPDTKAVPVTVKSLVFC